jgi:hypothetical protein
MPKSKAMSVWLTEQQASLMEKHRFSDEATTDLICRLLVQYDRCALPPVREQNNWGTKIYQYGFRLSAAGVKIFSRNRAGGSINADFGRLLDLALQLEPVTPWESVDQLLKWLRSLVPEAPAIDAARFVSTTVCTPEGILLPAVAKWVGDRRKLTKEELKNQKKLTPALCVRLSAVELLEEITNFCSRNLAIAFLDELEVAGHLAFVMGKGKATIKIRENRSYCWIELPVGKPQKRSASDPIHAIH